MAIRIASDCIICSACLPECPNNAIYEPGTAWNLADGTSVSQPFLLLNGTFSAATTSHAPFSNDYYYIVPDKCTECQGFHDEPQCASVCPIDVCVPDERYQETVAELVSKKEKLHGST